MLKKFLIALVLTCAGVAAHATTDIQPNGNLSGGNTAANCTQPVLGTYSGSTNFEAKWRANTVPLRWYNQGERITTVQDAAKTCDYDGVLNIPSSAPSRTGYTFGGWKVVPSLPAGYTELEYIQSSGTQYIETGLTGKTRWLGKGQSVQNTTKSQTLLIGTAVGVAGSFVGSVSSQNKWTTWGSPDTTYEITSAQDFDLSFDTTSVSGRIGDTVIFHNGLNINFDISWKICCHTSSYPYIGKIFWLKAYQNNALVRRFIPAKRNSDNVVGMYDTVSETFFTNAGTGSFTAGPELN